MKIIEENNEEKLLSKFSYSEGYKIKDNKIYFRERHLRYFKFIKNEKDYCKKCKYFIICLNLTDSFIASKVKLIFTNVMCKMVKQQIKNERR